MYERPLKVIKDMRIKAARKKSAGDKACASSYEAGLSNTDDDVDDDDDIHSFCNLIQ